MMDLCSSVSTHSESLNIILLIGIAILGGAIGARIFQKFRIPQIVGYIAIGILLGPVLKVINPATVKMLEPFNLFALGAIGFLIGSELKKEIFVKFGKQMIAILLFEGLTAFLLVGVLSFLAMVWFSDWRTSLAVAVVFGAICSATDPASTVGVLWEYKSRGPLTIILTAIVALDDALALFLYAVGVSVASVITGHHSIGFVMSLLLAFYEIFGSLIVGVVVGFILNWILSKIDDDDKMLIFTIAFVLLAIGIAIKIHLDVIVCSMALGVTLINFGSRRSKTSFAIMNRFTAPVYVLFFVLVGARLSVANASSVIWWLVAAYVVGSITGKTLGSYLGCVYAGSAAKIRKYLGFCLYPQGGIAIGLLIMASQKFDPEITSIMLLVVIIGAFILQIIGPIGVKIGAGKAGELGLNITEQDLIKVRNVGDMVDTKVPVITSCTLLSEVINIVSNTNNFYYSVVDNNKKPVGAITLDGIRNVFATQELNEWLVALDIAEPIVYSLNRDVALSEGLEKMKQLDVEYLPVIDTAACNKLIGVLDSKAVHRRLSAEVLAKQKQADNMHVKAAAF